MHSITENSNNEKFSVEKLLETQNFNRKRKKSIEEEIQNNTEKEETKVIHPIKRPNLKFGIDSILKESKDEYQMRPLIKYDNFPSLNTTVLIPGSNPTQTEYYFSRNSAPICYESQCISAYNKPLLQNYQYFYCNSYASNNPIATNNIGESNYSSIQNNYNFGSYYNHSSIRSGEQSSNQSGKSKKAKWNRAVFSNLQRKGLEKRFSIQKYITKPDRRKLAEMLRLSDSQVKVWFQNRRMKWRHSKEYRDELSKTATNKEQQLISNFPVNKTEENTQN